MVGINDKTGNLKPDEKQIEKPEARLVAAREPASVKPPVPTMGPAPVKQPVRATGPVPMKGPSGEKTPTVEKQTTEIKKDFSDITPPVQKKDEGRKPITAGKPLIIEPAEKKKPIMPVLKGEPGKRAVRVEKKKVVGKPLGRPKNRSLTLLLLVCLILLAGGAALLVLLTLDIALPGWAEPVLELYRKIPLFPE